MLQYLQILTKFSKNCLEKKKNPHKKASVSGKKECLCTSRFPSIYFQWMAFYEQDKELVKIIRVKKKKFLTYVEVHISKYLFLGKRARETIL
jgi:hypothetical protein